ncbi:hypothetical protein DCCM_2452 [Desulfocucumis palustris]|uniref:Radical SAM core domain-containing protein n=1 Tax=Desulfocucumis palustris TaxID=1898651 RepID=A0A2L2XCD5_9FIRM|nr:radical SAM protein [Desulfocucumis palustris]GBF33353.1 hypothetical protein DCCM_2452 [Desulfocucumis palustris]
MYIDKQRHDTIQFEVHLADHCNLNCQMCDHFSPLAEESYLTPEQFMRDIERLSYLFNECASYIRLLGGEPLLNPRVADMFSIARRGFPSANIELYTNGILLPDQNRLFWQSCCENAVNIVVTKYPIGFDYRKIELLCEEHGVRLFYNNPEPIKTSWHLPLDISGSNTAVEQHRKCDMANRCIMLKHGRLYPCTVAPNIEHFNRYFSMNLCLSPNDGIDIFEDVTAEQILSFLCMPIPFCRYCAIERQTYHHVWQTSKRQLSEWT